MKWYGIFTIILLATTLNGQKDTSKVLVWALGGQAADLLSTEIILMEGGMEINPLMTQRPVYIATKIGLSIMLYSYAKRYPDDKRTMTIFAILSWMPVVHNMMQIMN